MRSEDLYNVIQDILEVQSERQDLEMKSAEHGFPGRIYDTLSSFSNQTCGGVIIFGISDKPNYNVVGVYDTEDIQRKIMESCNQMEPAVRAVISMCEYDGKMVVSAEIPGVDYSLRPVFYKGKGRLAGSYVRVGDADIPMSEQEIYIFEAFRRHQQDDARAVTGSGKKWLDWEKVRAYIEIAKRDRPNLANSISDNDILEFMRITDGNDLTVAGLMMFSAYPQHYMPQLSITAVSILGNEIGDLGENKERFIDNERINGTIPEMLDKAVEFVKRNSRLSVIIDEDGKRRDVLEYPLIAIREAILNALVHRDYSTLSELIPITIVMYRNRIEIKNPGGLYGNLTIDDLGYVNTHTRNIVIARMMELFGYTENRFSGIPIIRRELAKFNMKPPVFVCRRGEFITTFYNNINHDSGTMCVRENYVENNLYNTQNKEFVRRDKEEECKLVYEFCRTAKTKKEIIEFIRRSPMYVTTNIVVPLLKEHKLCLTIPDKPKSRNQKYVSV